MVFYAQGGSREVQGWKGAVQGSQMDPLDGPIAGLVDGGTFFWTHFSGRPTRKVGPKKSIALDQTGYGAVQRVHLRPLNRTFPARYFPGSALSVENHCFGPWVQVPQKSSKKAPKLNREFYIRFGKAACWLRV